MTNVTPQEAIKQLVVEALHPRGYDLEFEPEFDGEIAVRYLLDNGDLSAPQVFIAPDGKVTPRFPMDPEVKRALRQAKVLETRKLSYNLLYLAMTARVTQEEVENEYDGQEDQAYRVVLKVLREIDSPLLDANFDVPGFIWTTLIGRSREAFEKAYAAATPIPEVDEEEVRQAAGWLAYVGAVIAEEFAARQRKGL